MDASSPPVAIPADLLEFSIPAESTPAPVSTWEMPSFAQGLDAHDSTDTHDED